jgi:hypothetical protein
MTQDGLNIQKIIGKQKGWNRKTNILSLSIIIKKNMNNHQKSNEAQENLNISDVSDSRKKLLLLVKGMDSNMEMFNITRGIDDVGYVVSNIQDIIHEIVKILDVK